MADLRVGDQAQNAVYHAQTGPQDRDDADGLSGQHLRLGRADRGLDFHFFRLEIPGHFIHHQHGDFIQQLAEILAAGFLVAHDAQFVLNQRMIKYDDLAHVFLPFTQDKIVLLLPRSGRMPRYIHSIITFFQAFCKPGGNPFPSFRLLFFLLCYTMQIKPLRPPVFLKIDRPGPDVCGAGAPAFPMKFNR